MHDRADGENACLGVVRPLIALLQRRVAIRRKEKPCVRISCSVSRQLNSEMIDKITPIECSQSQRKMVLWISIPLRPLLVRGGSINPHE